MLDLEHQRGPVASGAGGVGGADDGEPGGVARDVLDVLGQDREPVVDRALPAGDRGGVRGAGGGLGGGTGAGHLDQTGVGEMAREPVAALRQRLRSAVHLADLGPVAGGEKMVVDPQRHLRADLDREPEEVVERVGDPAVGRVLQRHHAVVGVPGMHLLEGGTDARHGDEFHRVAEPVEGRKMAVGPRRTQVGDAQVLLDRP